MHIFEWLMEYVHQPETPPTLDAGSVVSILISADFLQVRRPPPLPHTPAPPPQIAPHPTAGSTFPPQMESLVDLCLRFVHDHGSEVVRLPIDLGCLHEKLVARLADLHTADELERLRDKKDKLQVTGPCRYRPPSPHHHHTSTSSPLPPSRSPDCTHKLDALVRDEGVLHKCTYCQKLFTDAQAESEQCHKAPVRAAPPPQHTRLPVHPPRFSRRPRPPPSFR